MDTLNLEFTQPGDVRFFRNAQDFLSLELGGETHARVQLRRALPLTDPGRFICVADMEDKELAVLEDITQLEEEQAALVAAELELRYYTPVITAVHSIKEKMGSYYFDLSIGEHKKNAAVKDITKNLRQLPGSSTIVLTDVDGNRYLIEDLRVVKKKALRLLEPYLY
ncbi:MAG: DUF1854 domain-containing protein [Oscillospiraceae bacterium]|nr:DUF1854 domain-containing protein [Oscillospiraceae bacterium]